MIKGDSEMNYSIQKKEAFRILGVSQPLDKEIEKNFEQVPKFWMETSMNGTLPRLAAKMDSMPMSVLGVSACNCDEEWKY
jgi:AraC family transcriptional regulator